MKAKAVTRLRNIKIPTLLGMASAIQEQLQQPVFASISPSPAEIIPKLDKLQELYSETRQRNYSYMKLRDITVLEIKSDLADQCSAVNALAKGDESIIRASGFSFAKEPRRAELPLPPAILKVERGREMWHMKIKLECVPQRHYYMIEVVDDAGIVHHYSSSRSSLYIEDLEPNQTVAIRVCAVNARGAGNFSQYRKHYLPPA
jgi:hypothetical protein